MCPFDVRSYHCNTSCEVVNYGCSSRGTVLVVGGGPVGLVTALFLAQRGYNVEVQQHCHDQELDKRLQACAWCVNYWDTSYLK